MSSFRHAASSSRRRTFPSSLRQYSVTQPSKPPLKLVAELRKLTETSITKAREALVETHNDVNAALDWLQKDLAVSGAKKAAKVEGRMTKEGSIGISLLSRGYGEGIGSLRAAMVELNCETDFVGRNELFGKLVADVAHTAAFIAEEREQLDGIPKLLRPYPVDMLLDAPLLSQSSPMTHSQSTVGSAIRDTIAKVGEKITLRRATTSVLDATAHHKYRVFSYVHGSTTFPSQGRIGTLGSLRLTSPQLSHFMKSDAFRAELETLERSLARHIVGFNPQTIWPTGESRETALYEQPFMLYSGGESEEPVGRVLQGWGERRGMDKSIDPVVEVIEFVKWAVGEHVESQD